MAKTHSKAGVVVKRGAGGKFMGSVGSGAVDNRRISNKAYAKVYGQEKGLSMSNRQVGSRMRGVPAQGTFKRVPLGQVRAQYATAVRQARLRSPSGLGGASTAYFHMANKSRPGTLSHQDTVIQSRAIARVINERRAAKKASPKPKPAKTAVRTTPTAGQVLERKHYQQGWNTSKKGANVDRSGRSALERADDRGVSNAWYQGYEDYAADKPHRFGGR